MPSPKAELLRRAQKIKLLATDIDGVMTAGDVVVLKSGEEVKSFNSKDRLVLSLLRETKHPLIIAWITGRDSDVVARTAKDLGVNDLVQGCEDKKAALGKILKKYKLSFDQAAFIGDDLVDLSTLRTVGLSCCPQDAVRDVQESVHYISPLAGGRGVVRDVLEFILRAQKKWTPLIDAFYS